MKYQKNYDKFFFKFEVQGLYLSFREPPIYTDYLDCGIEQDEFYLDDKRLINIVHDLYRKKRKRKFLFNCVLALFIKSCRVDVDLFAEGFTLGS